MLLSHLVAANSLRGVSPFCQSFGTGLKMCVHMCVCICVYVVYVLYPRFGTCMKNVSACMYTCDMYIYVSVGSSKRTYICIYVRMYIHTYASN